MIMKHVIFIKCNTLFFIFRYAGVDVRTVVISAAVTDYAL